MRLKWVGVSRVSGLGVLAALLGLQLKADVIYNVTIDDPNNLLVGYDDLLRSTVIEAGNDWSKYLSIHPGTTTINVDISANTSIPRATGASVTSNLVSILPDGTRVYEQRMGELYRTGLAPFGPQPDAIVSISPDYLKNELSFAAVTPSNRTDALSVFRHELGHAIGNNGFLNLASGAAPSDSVGTGLASRSTTLTSTRTSSAFVANDGFGSGGCCGGALAATAPPGPLIRR